MNSVGIDLHRKRSHVAALDETGAQLLSRRIVNDPQTFLTLLDGIDGECRIALEATYGWEWLADVLQDAGYELHLAHPLRTKAIASARVKTDAVDARTLAHLLRADLLPEAYIAPREIRELRDLLRHRVALTRMRSALKNRVGAILAKHGIQRPYSDLFGPGGTRFLAELELPAPARRRLDSLLALIDDFTREIDHTSARDRAARQRGRLRRRALPDPRHRALHRDARDRRGRRHHALSHRPQLCAWAGLTPTVRSSDGSARLGHITHQGSPALRWALVEAAQHAARGSGPLRRHLRTDRQAPRQARRQGRRRAPDPHALLLRPTRRRDPLPGTPGHGAHDQTNGGHRMTRRADHVARQPDGSGHSSELACCQWPLPQPARTG